MMPKSALSIPAKTLFDLEQWGIRTASLFKQLRVESGIAPPNSPVDQTWFWSKKWQAIERQADYDIEAGNIDIFTSVDDLLTDLDS